MSCFLSTSHGPFFPFSHDYLDTPSNFALYFSLSAHLLPLRVRLAVIIYCAPMPFVKAQEKSSLECGTKTQPFYNHCSRYFVQHLCSWDKLHSSKEEGKEPKTKVYRKQDKNQSKIERENKSKNIRVRISSRSALPAASSSFVNSGKQKASSRTDCPPHARSLTDWCAAALEEEVMG
jgi:hypothetical protein